MHRRGWIAVATAIVLLLGITVPGAHMSVLGNMGDNSSSQSSESPMETGKQALKQNNYEKAAEQFSEVVQDNPRDADALNMLAYSQRKLGRLDEAIANYKKALEIRPRFPAAREYLGEAYLQAALKQLETLESYGEDAGKHRDDLKMAIKQAAKKLETATLSKGESNRDW